MSSDLIAGCQLASKGDNLTVYNWERERERGREGREERERGRDSKFHVTEAPIDLRRRRRKK